MQLLQLLLLASLAQTTAPASPTIPESLDFSIIRTIPVQHDGRWMPLDTLARDMVESVTGTAGWRGHDPVALLLAWTFDSGTWMEQPLIEIKNPELRESLELPANQTVFSYNALLSHPRFRRLMDDLAMAQDRKLNPLESKVRDIRERLSCLDAVLAGQAINLIPHPSDPLGAWKPIELVVGDKAGDPVKTAWASVGGAFLRGDGPAFTKACERLRSVLAGLPAAYRPSPDLIATELRSNRLHPLGLSWKIMLVGTVMGLTATIARKRVLDILTIAALVTGFGLLSYGMWLRWQIAGRIPASNMFESLLFMGWGTGFFGILWILFVRDRMVLLTASIVSAVSLVLADCLPLDQYIRPTPPVLMDTIWMSIHVPVIMVSYAVLAIAFVIAHGQMLVLAATPERSQLVKTIDRLHYLYVLAGSFLLLIGIVTGSMWAASSWGRYWGWDPKEVWSLIAFLAYLTILHVRASHEKVPSWLYILSLLLGVALFAIIAASLAPLTMMRWLGLASAAIAVVVCALARGPLGDAVKSIVAFWLIIMTYVGVNFVLGIGLHSYGFGTGAVVRYLFLFGAIDLVLVLSCVGIHYLRHNAWSGRAQSITSR
ncbi:MAG: cytochrome c biogenesis protein [Phycisphaerae bacterium]